MAKDRRKLQHIHSSILDKQPTPQSLEVGEIAVNNAANQEFLSIKNSDDVVKRFSSDEQIITWMERKEVMPYEGYTRGADGPAGSTGPNSVTNNDLLQNKSNIIIKLNQVAASNTVKHDKVNGAKDIYGKCVNPTSDSGVTDGAGFAIDMSRYAMMDANPSFSSVTVSAQTNLSGNTIISNGASANTYGTDTGHTLTIKTTDVVDTNTNWTETITNRTSIVTNETDKIITLNESATTRNTTVGTETLHVSGTTTETHGKAVTITNNSGVTETTKGNVVENVSANTAFNTIGTTTINSTGSTTIQSTGANSDVTIYAKDDLCETSDDVAAFKGANKTNVGIDCSDASRTKITNIYGDAINERANTADTRVTSAYTSATTATTIIGTANTSATTADYSGNTLNSHIKSWTHSGDTLNITESTSTTLKSPATTVSGTTLTINEGTSISAKTPTTYLSGTTLDVKETNTDITSCGRISANTNDFEVKQCAANGKFIVNSDDADISGKTLDVIENTSVIIKTPASTISGASLTVNESTSISAKTPSTTISGTNFNLNETNTTINSCGKVEITTDSYSLKQCSTSGGSAEFEFCNGYTVKSNDIKLQQCGSAGTISISAQTQNINGGNLTINESGNTAINTNGTTNIKSTGSTNIETNGANNNVTIQASGNGGDVEVFAKDTLCTSGGTTAAFVGATKTNIGMNCADAGNTAELNVRGIITNISAGTITQTTSGATNINVGGNLVEKITGTTTITSTGTTTIEATGANSNACISATDSARVYGKGSTYVGVKCDGTIGSATTIEGTTLVLSGNTTNISGATTLNLNGKTVNVDATDIDVDASNNYCLSAATKANIYGKTTNIGVDCGGTTATTINVSGTTINEGGTTNNNNFTTINNTATTINNKTTNYNITGTTYISGNTTISGTATIGDTLIIKKGLEKKLSWTYGDVKSAASGETNFKDDKSFVIPQCVGDINRAKLDYKYGESVASKTNGTYDPGEACNNAASDTIYIPTSIDNLSNWNGTCINLPHNVCVTGTITASGAIYSSDRALKDNIMEISDYELEKAKKVAIKSFTFRDDAEQRKTYGVIAQEVLDTGLLELVHTREDGMYGVDYTSLLILKIAYLENELKKTNEEFEKVKAINQSNQDKLTELIQNIKKLENKFDDMNNSVN